MPLCCGDLMPEVGDALPPLPLISRGAQPLIQRHEEAIGDVILDNVKPTVIDVWRITARHGQEQRRTSPRAGQPQSAPFHWAQVGVFCRECEDLTGDRTFGLVRVKASHEGDFYCIGAKRGKGEPNHREEAGKGAKEGGTKAGAQHDEIRLEVSKDAPAVIHLWARLEGECLRGRAGGALG